MAQGRGSNLTYRARLTLLQHKNRWVLTVIDERDRSVRIQPRGVFDKAKLERQLRRFGVQFTEIKFTDYTCEVYRAAGGNPAAQTKRFYFLLLGLYRRHDGRSIDWNWDVNYDV